MSLTIEELKKSLAIDKSNLDAEVSRQPVLFYEIAELYEDALAQADTLKEELGAVDAELDGQGRGILAQREDKVTEAMVKNHILLHKSHETAFKEWLVAKTHAGKLSALKDAFKQRGYMLRDLAQLHTASYFEQSSVHADRQNYDKRRRILAEARDAKVK